MRRILGLMIFLSISFYLVGCNTIKPILFRETASEVAEEEISYTVEQVILSKGFQSIEPKVEVLKKGLSLKILASIGLVQSSGINISKVVRTGNEIDIYIENLEDGKHSQLAVPQVIIELKGTKLRKREDLHFNIVNENYKPLKLKFGINEVINKITSDYKIVSNTSPISNLLSEGDKLLWDITYNSIFDKDNLEAPLANLSVTIDANTGDILSTKKIFISSLIDEGHILDYVAEKYILYTKAELDMDKKIIKENLWSYDIENNEKSLLYSSNMKIDCATFSPTLNHISLLEIGENTSELYIIPRVDKKAYKVLFEDHQTPTLIRWKDDDTIYILDNNTQGITDIYEYNIGENHTKLISKVDKNIVGLRIMNDVFLIVEPDEDKLNLKISLTKDWKNFRLLDYGLSPRFIDEDKIAYLKSTEKEDKKVLYIYDTKSREKYDLIDLNISNFFVLPDGNIIIVENNPSNNNFTVIEYDSQSKKTAIIAKANSDKLFYNKEKNLLYVYLQIPFESDKTELIYSIDLSKITNLEP